METQNIFQPAKVDLSIRTYCGPTVLRLLTGKTKEEIHRDVNKLRRKAGKKSLQRTGRGWGAGHKYIPWRLSNAVKGVAQNNMDALLAKYGFKPKRVKITGKKQSLITFADDAAPIKKPIVIVTGNHYVLLVGGKVYDTYHINGETPALHHFGKTRVTEYWILQKINPVQEPEAQPELVTPAPVKPKKDLRRIRYEKAKAQAGAWESKARRAAKLAKKWTAKVKRYEKIFAEGK